MTTEEFIKRANKYHNNKYDYSLIKNICWNVNFDFICPKHGIFSQTVNNHLFGKGCPSCSKENRKSRKMTTSTFIEKSEKIHRNKYDYSLVEYIGQRDEVIIICPTHGVFKQKPGDHLSGCGCKLCAFKKFSEIRSSNSDEFIKKAIKKLKRQQRSLSRKQKGSKNRTKQRIAVAKQHEKITNQRTDFLQKLSTKFVCDNQATTFCMEDLSAKNMMKNHKLAQSISDVSWNRFVLLMKYKCEWYGKNIIFIGRFDPSSKTCSCCGEINKNLKLSDRNWTCEICNTKHDRDVNAAKNILSFAFHSKNKIGRVPSDYKPAEKIIPFAKNKSRSSAKQESFEVPGS